MKLLVFAHTPPPHHGQSFMVQLMLEGLGGDCRKRRRDGDGGSRARRLPETAGIECYHVNARLSRHLEDIGDLRIGKFILLIWYCLQAIWCRFRYGVTNFYYIPAPGKRSALYRDWLVMLLCRPFFRRFILHWHASGLGKWLETMVQIRTRSITYNLAKNADLSIVLSNYGRGDADKLFPRNVAVVGNGIPDPCPDFARAVLPRRRARLEARRLLSAGKPLPPEIAAGAGTDPHVFKVLFMAHCTRDKGLFDAVEGAVLAHRKLAEQGSPLFLKLVVAGQFLHGDEEAEFHRLCATLGQEVVEYVGFVSGENKQQLLENSDAFCFPSHLESFGLVLAEAMAFGLPIVTTRCGAVPEVMTPEHPGLVEVRAPAQIAAALLRLTDDESFEALRQRFESHFTIEQHLFRLARALRTVADSGSTKG